MSSNDPSISEILKEQLYLGNLSAALSVDHRKEYGITHVLSVCPESPQMENGQNHLNISVEDSEFEDLLIHLPQACQFIENALEQGGRVLVHCVMGVCRSPAVVAAFLMKKERMTAPQAVTFVKQRKPNVHLNYGFARQLDMFMKCDFNPTLANPVYRSWKRRHEQDVTVFLNHIDNTVSIIPDKLLLCSDFPSGQEQIWSFLMDMGVTHLLAISPAEISIAGVPIANYHHVNVDSRDADALMSVLPDVCAYIDSAMKDEGLVLVYSMIESRCCTAVCAYLMSMKNHTAVQAFNVIRQVLPLFNPTRNFIRNLELYEQHGYAPPISTSPSRTKERPGPQSSSNKVVQQSVADEYSAMTSHLEGCADSANKAGESIRRIGRAQSSMIAVR